MFLSKSSDTDRENQHIGCRDPGIYCGWEACKYEQLNKKTVGLGFIGDEILPSHVGILRKPLQGSL